MRPGPETIMLGERLFQCLTFFSDLTYFSETLTHFWLYWDRLVQINEMLMNISTHQ
jgi:hypothetical protein